MAKKKPTSKAKIKAADAKPKAGSAEEKPCGRAVHTDPDTPATAEQKPLPDEISKTPLEQKSPAQWAYERLVLYIQNFEEQLDDEHEVAVGFAGAGSGALRIEGIGFFDPDIVTFYGADQDGAKTQLIQHVTQLSVTLRAMPKQVSEKKAIRIGFRLAEDLKKA